MRGNIAPIDESEYIVGAHRYCAALIGTGTIAPPPTRENRPVGTPPAPLSHALRGAAQPAAP